EYVFQKQEDNENVARLHSIIGVSKYMAVVFYVEFANKKFHSKEAMYAFVGCDPKLKQSGEKMVGVRMSKRGNAYTRKKLYQCAFCAKLHCKELAEIYEKTKKR
ncbi:MAG: IS110 family transposase, partial [Candidatus Peribacteria bacterium]|nr:IS110 family transposase [Candidatus Peribacteria bacterium]